MSTIDDQGTPSGAGFGFRGTTRKIAWAKRALVATFVAAGTGLAAPAAWAANADQLQVNVEVKPVDSAGSAVVSVSRPGLPTFVSVKMLVKNAGTNTINKVAVRASTTVYQGASGDVAGYSKFVNLQTASPNGACARPRAGRPRWSSSSPQR
jgi:hypothetical protein